MTSTGPDGKTSNKLTRRQLIYSLGAVGATSGLAGCNLLDRDSSSPERDKTEGSPLTDPLEGREPFNQYDTIVNFVDEGADTAANESIIPLLKEHAGDDTLLYLPSGRYLMDEMWYNPAFRNLGIYGDGATIVPPEGYTDPLFVLGDEGARDCYVEGLNFDFSNPSTASPPVIVRVDDGLTVRNISVSGTSGRTQFEVFQSDGTGLVENLHIPDGGFAPEYPPGCYVSERNQGELMLRNFSIANFPNNGIYASGSTGPVRVVGGVFENNDISNVRVGDGGLIRNVDVKCTNTSREHKNMRGFWAKGTGGIDATIENCTVRLEDINSSDGAVVASNGTTIRNTEIEINGDEIAAITNKDPPGGSDSAQVSEPTTIENVSVTGSAADGAAVTVIEHDGCTFHDVTVNQTGENRNGIEFYSVSDAVLRNLDIEVTGEPIIRNDSNVRIVSPDTMT